MQPQVPKGTKWEFRRDKWTLRLNHSSTPPWHDWCASWIPGILYLIKKKKKWGWSSHCGSAGYEPNLTSIHEDVASLRGLRIQHYCELWNRLQMRLSSGFAVVYASCCGSDSTPSMGTYATGVALKKKKRSSLNFISTIWVLISCILTVNIRNRC